MNNGKHMPEKAFPRWIRVRFALFVVLCFLSFPAAASGPGGGPKRRTLVLIGSRQAEGPTRKVVRAIRSQLLGLKVALEVAWVPRLQPDLPGQTASAVRITAGRSAVMVMWCDFAQVDKVFLYFVESRGGRVLVRQVPQADVGTAGRFEAIGAIVRASVGAVLRGGRIGIRVDPPKTSPVIRRPAPFRLRPKPVSISLSAGYSLAGYSSGEPLLHSGVAAVAVSFLKHCSAELGYGFAPSITVKDSGTTLRIYRHTLSAAFGFGWPLGRWTVGGQAAVAVGMLDRRTFVHRDNLNAGPDELDVTVSIEAAFRAAFRIKPWMSVFTGVGAAFAVLNAEYSVSIEGRPVTLLRPWVAQPFWITGVRFTVY